MTLPDIIAKAVREDGLTALTLFPCEAGWQASVRFVDSQGWRVRVAATAVDALLEALATAAAPEDVFA